MAPAELPRLEVADARAWRAWLRRNHASSPGVSLVFRKPARGLTHAEALDEALCYGWIDSLVRRLDEERYVLKFTPRTDPRRWSEANKAHARRLVAEGRMTEAGRRVIGVPLGDGPSETPRPAPPSEPPPFVARALAARPRAAAFFSSLAAGYRRRYLGYVLAAKQPATRERRLAEVLDLLEQGVKTAMK